MDKHQITLSLICSILMLQTAVAKVNPNDYYDNIDAFQKKNEQVFQPSYINGQDTFGKYQNRVDQAQNAPAKTYYDDEGKLNQKAEQQRSSEIYKTGIAVKNKEPDLNLIEKSDYVQSNQLYIDDAYNVAHGISDAKVDCEGGRVCHYEYEHRTCEKSNNQSISCTKEPVIETVSYKISNCKHYSISGTSIQTLEGANAQGYCQTDIKSWQGSGYNTSINQTQSSSLTIPANYQGVHVALFATISGRFENTSAGVSESVSSIGSIYVGTIYSPGYYQNVISVAQSDTETNHPFSISMGFATGRGYNTLFYGSFVEYPQIQKKEVVSRWQTNCPWKEPTPEGCHYQGNEYCIISGDTRIIDGLPIYQSCWKYQQDYTCTSSPEVDTCTKMAEDRCNVQGHTCEVTIAGLCVKSKYDYSCPVKTCDERPLACGKPAFCIDGDCYSPDDQKQPPDQLGKVAAEMRAAQAAADHLKQNSDGSISIFTGERMGCSVAIAGSNNCCTDGGGWNPVGSCSEEEKHLAEQKQKHLVIDNGEYCKNKSIGVCTSNERPSCVYPDLITKDIIEQGVIGQLYHGSTNAFYGDAKDTNCRGITPEELEKINFDTIDFSNIEDELKQNMDVPQSGQGNQNADDKSKCILDGSCKNDYQKDQEKNCLTDGTCHF